MYNSTSSRAQRVYNFKNSQYFVVCDLTSFYNAGKCHGMDCFLGRYFADVVRRTNAGRLVTRTLFQNYASTCEKNYIETCEMNRYDLIPDPLQEAHV